MKTFVCGPYKHRSLEENKSILVNMEIERFCETCEFVEDGYNEHTIIFQFSEEGFLAFTVAHPGASHYLKSYEVLQQEPCTS